MSAHPLAHTAPAPAARPRLPSLWDRPTDWQMALLVIGFGLLLYVPLAGTYGLWDPWETHYAEVARQMTRRGDFISLWWPGSFRDPAVFQTKPVLTFWLMSLGMHLFGVARPGGDPGEMAVGHAVEWAVRLPFCVLGALGLYGVYLVTARLAGRRAAVLAALVTATCPFYAMVARQAITDMTFVAPLTLALALGALALVDGDDDPMAGALPRRGRGRLSWPHHPLFYGGLALFAACTVPQLVIDSIDLRVTLPWGDRTVTMYGAVAMIPYYLGWLAFVWLMARARQRAPLQLYIAATLCGLAVLGKGLAGLAMPGLIFVLFALVSGSWRAVGRRRLWGPLLIGLLGCAVVAVPWHHAMILRHGLAWWNELFGDNHWRRLVLGRPGDRGTFVYFLRELGYGTWPWVALAPVALARAALGRALPLAPRRQALLALGAVWSVTAYAVVSLSMTKFHHYVLPAVPALGILIGCLLDEWLDRPGPAVARTAALIGLPLLGLVVVDLVSSPNASQRFFWLFTYDYVYNPRGRTWPAGLDFRPALLAFAGFFALALGAALVPRLRRVSTALLLVGAVAFALFLNDVFMPRVSHYWSQKGALAAYYQLRRSPDEHLLAYRMYWRGETFYTQNTIYEGPPEERTVFDSDGDEADLALRRFLDRHRGQRHFFLFEPGRLGHLQSLLPPEARASWRVVEQPCNKFWLATAQL